MIKLAYKARGGAGYRNRVNTRSFASPKRKRKSVWIEHKNNLYDVRWFDPKIDEDASFSYGFTGSYRQAKEMKANYLKNKKNKA